jgi:hypothetical protein
VGRALRPFVLSIACACALDRSGVAERSDGGPLADAGPIDGGPLEAARPDGGSDGCGALLETCNGIDDDCDGSVDEGPSLCGDGCTVIADGGATYAFCASSLSWQEASAHCVDRGYELVVLTDLAESDRVAMTAASIREGDWWIGLWSPANDDAYEWVDGSVSDFYRWEDTPGGQCVKLRTSDGAWAGKGCGGSRAFVCEAVVNGTGG